MNNKMILAAAAVAAIVVILIASFIAFGNEKEDPKDPTIVDEWDMVAVYSGSWIDGTPAFSEDTTQHATAKIEHYKGDFYTFNDGQDRLYCTWDGEKLITAQDTNSSMIIMENKTNNNFLTVLYFDYYDNAIVELYQRHGYVGDFPGFEIPLDLPAVGTTMESFKNREYTPDGRVDRNTNVMTIRDVDGPFLYYNALLDDNTFEFTCIYISHGIFMTLGVSDDMYVFDMTEYRGGVFYCASKDLEDSSTWVSEYGDESKKDYPDINLTKRTYSGTEDFVIYKDGKVIEQKYGNEMTLRVVDQDDECVYLSAIDKDGDESAMWSMMINDLRPDYHYGVSVQSVIEYDGVQYIGQYYGHFTSKSCDGLEVCGTLVSDDGYYIVIAQTYTLE